ETMVRLLRPGIHSGTVPKQFARLRRAERRGLRTGDWGAAVKHRAALHHVEEAGRHLLERELVALLNGSRGWGGPPPGGGRRVRLATNRIAVELPCPELGDAGLCIDFELHDRSLTAGVARPGWLPHLSAEQRYVLRMGLAGLYKKAGVSAVWQPTGAAPLTDG